MADVRIYHRDVLERMHASKNEKERETERQKEGGRTRKRERDLWKLTYAHVRPPLGSAAGCGE
jgi:hypothetical protein